MLAHRLDAAAEVDALRAGRRVEQLGERRRQRAALVERAQDVLARRRMDPLEQRQDLAPDQPARRRRRSTSRRGTRARARGRTPRSPRARRQSSGRTTPSSRRALIPFVVAARDEPVEDRLDLVARGVAGRAKAAAAPARSGARAARPRSSPAPPARDDLGAELSAQKRASASDSAPRRPWSTCSAETR